MSLFSIFSKTPREATSVAEALAGTIDSAPAKSKSRRSENRDAQNEQLVPEKKRARRRLIGAVAIVLAVVIGLPMVLDSEPKPLNKNIAIQIPSKDNLTPSTDVKEEVVKDAPVKDEPVQNDAADQTPKQPTASATTAITTVDTAQLARSAPVPKSTPAPEIAKADAKHAVESAPKKDSAPKSKPLSKSTDAPAAKSDDSARALAILSGGDSASTAGSNAGTKSAATRSVLQAGAFATQDAVKELQDKLSSAGIKSFTQKVATSSGDKIRVRVGPFADKESADKMKQQLEKLGLKPKLIPL